MSAEKSKVVIVVGGGVLQGVYSSFPDLDVELIDTDNLIADRWRNSAIDDLIAEATDPLYPNIVR
jgi:hypothetical protein